MRLNTTGNNEMKKYAMVAALCLSGAYAWAGDASPPAPPVPNGPTPDEIIAQYVISIGQLQVQLGQGRLRELELRKQLDKMTAAETAAKAEVKPEVKAETPKAGK